MKPFATAASIALALALAACSTTPTASVLRFHQNQPINRGTIVIKPQNPAMANSLEFQAQANAVGAELRAQGFTVVGNPAQAQYTAIVNLTTSERVTAGRQSGVSVGIGGGFSSGNVGIGTSVNVPVGGQPRPNVATTTTLSVAIVGPTGQSLWEGRSSLDTQAGGQNGTALAPVLAQTMFAGFPGPSGQTVQVPIR
jgi:hypothetical protein